MRKILFRTLTAIAIAIAVFVPCKTQAETFANSQTADSNWRCFASTQDSGTFEITWGIPIEAFSVNPESIVSQTLKLATWNYVQAQGFYLSVSSTPLSNSFTLPDAGWINSTETYTSRTEGVQSGLSGYTDSITDAFTGNVLTFTFPTNTVGAGLESGTIWFRLRGNHPGNQGDRACIRSGSSDSGSVLYDYEHGDPPLDEMPTGALTYTNTSAGLLPFDWGTEYPTIASSTSLAFSTSTIDGMCDGFANATGSWGNIIGQSIAWGGCKVTLALIAPDPNALNALVTKKDQLLTQFPFSTVSDFMGAFTTSTEASTATSTIGFNASTFFGESASGTTLTFFSPSTVHMFIPDSTWTVMYWLMRVAIWVGFVFAEYYRIRAIWNRNNAHHL